MHHDFIFAPGVWTGEGSISFSMAEDVLKFTMNWTILPEEDEKIYFYQEIDVEGFAEKTRNHFCVRQLSESSFEIQLENVVVGKVQGIGLITPQTVAWEFRRADQGFEGYEIYELQEDGSYKVRGEFTAGPGMRTTISGQISQ